MICAGLLWEGPTQNHHFVRNCLTWGGGQGLTQNRFSSSDNSESKVAVNIAIKKKKKKITLKTHDLEHCKISKPP